MQVICCRYERLNNLKATNPNMKTLLAVGGWTMGMKNATLMMGTPENRTHFVHQSKEFIKEHGFDGIDMGN